MPARTLPPRPSLDQLRLQAHELHRALRDGDVSAAARFAAHHPRLARTRPIEILDLPLALADAQFVLAREYGFPDWAALKHRVEMGHEIARLQPHPRFADALDALDAGDVAALRALLDAHPDVVRARTNLDPPYHYFSGATLLHHVAGNPDRGRPLPANVVDAARLLLDAGADVRARTLGPNGGDTMGLLLTSRQASDAGVTGPLVDLLLSRGARLDVTTPGCLDGPLANHAPAAAEKLIALGAAPDLLAAAALGRMDWLTGLFDADGRLLRRPVRHGREMSDRDAVGLALLYAYVREQRAAVDFLLDRDGNWNMTGVNNGAALHRAAIAGDLAMVERLVARGADTGDRNNPFCSTPLAWADHGGQQAVVAWLRAHTRVDLHDAVCFDFREHAAARLDEDPDAVNRRLDQWDLPQGTPLHWAAALNRAELAALLLERGADRNTFAGNGLLPLDLADAAGAAAVARLLDERGARRAADLPTRSQVRSRPAFEIDEAHGVLQVRPLLTDADWDAVVDAMRTRRIAGLDAGGQMTDAVAARIAGLEHVTRLDLGGSRRLGDAGLRALARLPALQRLEIAFTGVTDAGAAALAACGRLERVNLEGTATGDATVTALAGKPHLRVLAVGADVTAGALRVLHEFPAFRAWTGGEPSYGLMAFDAGPTNLQLHPRTPFRQDALSALIGLDGLFALHLDHPSATHLDLAPLRELPRLGWLGHDATDASMRQIAALPHLRMLMAQDTEAGDAGFTALGGSATLEYIWGRRCYNLTGRGFRALAAMPSLRGLSVSCRHVDDDALAALPRFPALRELMPMDVPDAGFRHIARCEALEALWCMYCRDTTDAATGHIAGLPNLRTYYAGQTKITDGSLDLLAAMPSLERLTFWNCAGITNAGVRRLTALPRLRELTLDGCRQVTPEVAEAFANGVRVRVSA